MKIFKFVLVFFEIFSLFNAGDEMAITSYFTCMNRGLFCPLSVSFLSILVSERLVAAILDSFIPSSWWRNDV